MRTLERWFPFGLPVLSLLLAVMLLPGGPVAVAEDAPAPGGAVVETVANRRSRAAPNLGIRAPGPRLARGATAARPGGSRRPEPERSDRVRPDTRRMLDRPSPAPQPGAPDPAPRDRGGEWMVAWQRGDERAFAQLVEAYSGAVWSLLTRFLGWLGPLNPIGKEEQQLLGLRGGGAKPMSDEDEGMGGGGDEADEPSPRQAQPGSPLTA